MHVAVTSEVGEADRLPLGSAEGPDCLAELLADDEVQNLVLDDVVSFGAVGDALLTASPSAFRTDDVDSSAVALSQQEGSQRTSGRVEPLSARPQPDEDVLNDLFRQFPD